MSLKDDKIRNLARYSEAQMNGSTVILLGLYSVPDDYIDPDIYTVKIRDHGPSISYVNLSTEVLFTLKWTEPESDENE